MLRESESLSEQCRCLVATVIGKTLLKNVLDKDTALKKPTLQMMTQYLRHGQVCTYYLGSSRYKIKQVLPENFAVSLKYVLFVLEKRRALLYGTVRQVRSHRKLVEQGVIPVMINFLRVNDDDVVLQMMGKYLNLSLSCSFPLLPPHLIEKLLRV